MLRRLVALTLSVVAGWTVLAAQSGVAFAAGWSTLPAQNSAPFLRNPAIDDDGGRAFH